MEFELVQGIDCLGQKVLSCLSAECQHWTGPSAGSQAPEPFPEFQALLLFSFLEKCRCCTVPRGQQAAVQLPPRENMTQVNNFLVSVHEGMISILMPQGFLGCYQPFPDWVSRRSSPMDGPFSSLGFRSSSSGSPAAGPVAFGLVI